LIIHFIEVWHKGVDETVLIDQKEDYCSLMLTIHNSIHNYDRDSNEVFAEIAKFFNGEEAGLVLVKPKSQQLLFACVDGRVNVMPLKIPGFLFL
jgi:hypothetical protein